MIALIFIIAEAHADAVCRDGWYSRSSGSGTCSHHGGVAYWVDPYPVAPPPPPAPPKPAPKGAPPPAPPATSAAPPATPPQSSPVSAGGVINLTVSDMLPYLTNKEASDVWLIDTAEAIKSGKVSTSDPNNPNKYSSLKDSIPPLWTCTDGEGVNQVIFSCWHQDQAKCVPEWHKLLEMPCPVSCRRNQ